MTPEFLDAGLAARPLLAMPPKKPKSWTDAEVDPDLTASLEAGLRLIEGLARELPPHEATLVHGGFYPREVLVGGHGVAIVDMDKIHNADPAIDLGNFIADLRWRGLQLGWSEEKARSSSQTFLSAYRPAIPSELSRGVARGVAEASLPDRSGSIV